MTMTKAMGMTAMVEKQGLGAGLGRRVYMCVYVAVAVVVAFFLCWAPFHAQRLLTIYTSEDQWTATLLEIQTVLFYISGHPPPPPPPPPPPTPSPPTPPLFSLLYTGASIPPETMMHFPPVLDFPPISETFSDFLTNFDNFTFFRKIS